MKKGKILIFSTAYLPMIGGSELAIKSITDRLSDIEFELITARFDKKNLPVERIGNINVYRLGLGSKLDKILLPVLGFFKARKLIKNQKVILHSYQASQGGGAAWLVKLFDRRRHLILTIQEGKDLAHQNFMVRLLRSLIIKKSDSITAISRYLKNYIFNIRTDIAVEVIPNGVDMGVFSYQPSYGEIAELETSLGIKPDEKVIISVSRLVPKNGLDVLIQSLIPLSEEKQNYKLLLVGDGPDFQSLRSQVKNLNLENKVIFVGAASQAALPYYFKIADVFVRPSRSEGLGSAFLEAMVADVPVIGTKVGGIPDFLEDGVTGLFCSLDPGDIASKIQKIVENDKLRENIIENARNLVKEKYDWDKIADKFRNLYDKFLI